MVSSLPDAFLRMSSCERQRQLPVMTAGGAPPSVVTGNSEVQQSTAAVTKQPKGSPLFDAAAALRDETMTEDRENFVYQPSPLLKSTTALAPRRVDEPRSHPSVKASADLAYRIDMLHTGSAGSMQSPWKSNMLSTRRRFDTVFDANAHQHDDSETASEQSEMSEATMETMQRKRQSMTGSGEDPTPANQSAVSGQKSDMVGFNASTGSVDVPASAIVKQQPRDVRSTRTGDEVAHSDPMLRSALRAPRRMVG